MAQQEYEESGESRQVARLAGREMEGRWTRDQVVGRGIVLQAVFEMISTQCTLLRTCLGLLVC